MGKMSQPVEHTFAVEHTAAAVDDQTVRREIFREIASGKEFKIQLAAAFFLKQHGDFYSADIIFPCVMSTGFCDENFVIFPQGADGFCSLHELFQITFESCH